MFYAQSTITAYQGGRERERESEREGGDRERDRERQLRHRDRDRQRQRQTETERQREKQNLKNHLLVLLSDPTVPDGIKPRWQTAEQQRSARYQSMTATGPETGRECVREPAPHRSRLALSRAQRPVPPGWQRLRAH